MDVSKKNDSADLRKLAEQRIHRLTGDFSQYTPAEIARLFHELQVHQIELELQNEELQNTQRDLEQSRDCYSHLFHNAPIGYIIVDSRGMIKQFNHTFAAMVKRKHAQLFNRPFTNFVHPDDRDNYLNRFTTFFKNPEDKCFELRLDNQTSAGIIVKISGKITRYNIDAPKEEQEIDETENLLITITDITESKRSELRTFQLNSILKAIREVNTLINQLRSIPILLREICSILVQDTVMTGAWIVVQNKDGEIVSAETGFGQPFERFLESYTCGDIPECIQKTSKSDNVTLIQESQSFCDQCPIAHQFETQSVFITKLAYMDTPHGYMSLTAPKSLSQIDEIQTLIGEIASDTAFTIHNIFLEEERQATKQKLEETNQTLTDILESISDGFIALDNNLVVTYYNQAAEQLLGKSSKEVMENNLFDSFPEAKGSIFEEKFNFVIKEKQFTSFETYFDVEPFNDWYNVRVYPHSNGISIFFQITTSHKEAEERLAYQAQLLDNLRESVVGTDLEGRITYWGQGAQKLYGYTEQEAVGKIVAFVVETPEELEEEQKRMQHALEHGSWSGEYYQVKKDGTRFLADTFISLVKDSEGRPIGFIGMDRDITERKKAEEERLQLERQMQHVQKLESLGVLAGGIAHDFNNILMTILGNADLSLIELSPHAPAREHIHEIITAARRASDLSRQLLAYSGKGKFVIEPIRLNEFINEMSHLLSVSVSKNVVIKYNFADNLPIFEGDATQIRQIIMNLITNASEAIGNKSGYIAISTGVMECDRHYLDECCQVSRLNIDPPPAEGTYVYFEVADTGCGMDNNTKEKIFDPFFTTKFTGRGLGMAAVLGIVRGHDGIMRIYSEIGEGTTFKILFPVQEKYLLPDDPSRKKDDVPSFDDIKKGIVLIVDDEETVRTVGKRMLQHLGFNVLTAEDGRDAMKVFKSHQDEITCVLLDMTMPHMDGEATFREIRRIRKDVKVILCSGYNEQDTTQRFVGKGLAGFIQKPFQLTELKKKLFEVLR